MTRRFVAHGDAMTALLELVAAPVLDFDAFGRGLLRLSPDEQVLLGGVLMRLEDVPGLVRIGEALACRGARRIATLYQRTLNTEKTP